MPTRIDPGPGQESVWDYPRPPRMEPCGRRVRVEFAGTTIADSINALRVLETASPPTIYVPADDVRVELLRATDAATFCEWKGRASYRDVVVDGRVATEAAWTYLRPTPAYAELEGCVAFYPDRVDRCLLDDEPVRPQGGGYYGGWVTDDIVGPWKGGPGTHAW